MYFTDQLRILKHAQLNARAPGQSIFSNLLSNIEHVVLLFQMPFSDRDITHTISVIRPSPVKSMNVESSGTTRSERIKRSQVR